MSNRINLFKLEPDAYTAFAGLENYLQNSGLSKTHGELIKIRASQINGCAYCIDKHTKDARKAGESEQRIYALSAWRETPFFSDEERAILALTEEVTLIQTQVSDQTYKIAAEILEPIYLAKVIAAISIINLWNRIGISTGMQPALSSGKD